MINISVDKTKQRVCPSGVNALQFHNILEEERIYWRNRAAGRLTARDITSQNSYMQ